MSNIHKFPEVALSVPLLEMIKRLEGKSNFFDFNEYLNGQSGLTDDAKISLAKAIFTNETVFTRPDDKSELFIVLPNQTNLSKVSISIEPPLNSLPWSALVGKLLSPECLDTRYCDMISEHYHLVLGMIDKIKKGKIENIDFSTCIDDVVIKIDDLMFTIGLCDFYGVKVYALAISKPEQKDFFAVPLGFFPLFDEAVGMLESLSMQYKRVPLASEQVTDQAIKNNIAQQLSETRINLLSRIFTARTHQRFNT